MFSALKVITASVIVALFGGFLLTGALTTPQGDEMAPAAMTESPSPMTTRGSLPGVALNVEPVEPGVYWVVDDGVRDLTSVKAEDIVAGYDGGIWLVRKDGVLRLGSDEVPRGGHVVRRGDQPSRSRRTARCGSSRAGRTVARAVR